MAATRGLRHAACARWGGSLPHGRRHRSSGARGTDSSPRDGTPRRRSRAARRQRRGARRERHTRSPVGSRDRLPPGPGASPRGRPRRSRRAGSDPRIMLRSSKPMWCTMTSTPRLSIHRAHCTRSWRTEVVAHHLDAERPTGLDDPSERGLVGPPHHDDEIGAGLGHHLGLEIPAVHRLQIGDDRVVRETAREAPRPRGALRRESAAFRLRASRRRLRRPRQPCREPPRATSGRARVERWDA